MPHKNPLPGTKPGQVFVATGSIYRTRDAGRAWYEHSKKVLEAAGFMESRPEQGLHYLHGPSGLEDEPWKAHSRALRSLDTEACWTVVAVGTAVSARLVYWCVCGGSETEQGDA